MFFQKYLDPKNDYAFKRVFGQEKHKEIPIAFLNAVFHLEGDDYIVDLQFLDSVQPPEIEARKESIVDVLVRDQKGSKYIIEMQVAKVQGFEKRAQFYAAKAYCSHFNAGGKYEDLKRVVFLAITDYEVFPEKEDYKSEHVILDTKTLEHDLKDFSFTFVELPKFKKLISELESIEDKWYYYLKHSIENREIVPALASVPEIVQAYHILETGQWTEAELRYYEKIAKASADAVAVMDAAISDAKAQGLAKGQAEGQADIIRQLLNTFDVSQIALMTNMDISEIENLRDANSYCVPSNREVQQTD